MTATLADSLCLVVPHLSPALVPARSLPRIQATATQLPPIILAGFECRLAEGESQVDFQQGIRFDEGQGDLLSVFLDEQSNSPNCALPAEWRPRLGSLWRAWHTPSSSLYQCVSDLWLEFDLDEQKDSLPAPSVFIGLKRERLASVDAQAAIALTAETLRGAALNEQVLESIARCFDAVPPPALVTHVGLMMSRPTDALRINVSHLPPESMSDFLQAAGWPHATAEFEEIVARLFDHSDKVRLCLDIGDCVQPRLGLECFFERSRGLDFRWPPLLDMLVAQGLCAPAKRDALLAWPGTLFPRNTPQAWPGHVVAASLCRKGPSLSVIDRQLSHIKVSYLPGRGCDAKAYFGFTHDWLPFPKRDVGRTGQRTCQPDAENAWEGAAVSQAIDLGTSFLLKKQTQGGWWLDYFTIPARASDVWSTAFVATALASLESPRLRPAIERAWRRVAARQEAQSGWAWNRLIPADSDTTAWALRLAKIVGAMPREPLQQGRAFIARHLRPCGGVACYDESYFRETTGNQERPLEGWSQPHACVTVAAAWVDGFSEPACRFLRNAQQEDGHWKAYWWEDYEYATTLAVEALAQFGSADDHPRIARAVQWAASRIEPEGAVLSLFQKSPSAHAAALNIRTMALGEKMRLSDQKDARQCLDRAVDWLLAQQNDDGSWPASAWMRTPMPHVVVPEEFPSETVLAIDTERLITTAAAVAALHAARAARVRAG